MALNYSICTSDREDPESSELFNVCTTAVESMGVGDDKSQKLNNHTLDMINPNGHLDDRWQKPTACHVGS